LVLLQFNCGATSLDDEEAFGKIKSLSLAQIVKATGLPKETVKMCLAQLLGKNAPVVVEVAPPSTRKGVENMNYELNEQYFREQAASITKSALCTPQKGKVARKIMISGGSSRIGGEIETLQADAEHDDSPTKG
jgi:hypothetical protein